MGKEKVLIVEDEREIAELIKDYLEVENYQVQMAFDGESGLELFRTFQPDIAVLDIMLPGMDGTELCRLIRNESNLPVLMLSARKQDVDKIISLGLGADDYLTKPFSPGELVARIKAHLRRYLQMCKEQGSSDSNKSGADNKELAQAGLEQRWLKFVGLEVDLLGHQVLVAGAEVALSAKEFALLVFLARSAGQVFTREQIFNQVWGFDEYGDINTVTVHIRRIREKIEQDPANPKYISTIWGVGYKFIGGKI